MFTTARVKLTAWYLAIIMSISFFFSVIIYSGVNRELVRIQNFQKARIQKIIGGRIGVFEVPLSQLDLDEIDQSRNKILLTLGIINLSILVMSGVGGYFLAGRTLDPIAKMIEEQKEFVGNASHELRTPITSLKTEIEVFLRGKKSKLSDAISLLKSNLEDVNRMQKLSNYLLEVSRYESGRKLSFQKINLADVVGEALGKLKVKKDLQNTTVWANKDAVIELTRILVDNAIKYSRKNPKVVVKVKSKTIEVSDNGIGIAASDIPHIFERFYRSDKSRSLHKVEGYGLGLSIAESIVRLHGARIYVSSIVDKGTTFRVVFK